MSKMDEVRKNLAEAAGKLAGEVKNAVSTGVEAAREGLVELLAKDRELTPEQLDDKYNQDGSGQHPEFTRTKWKEQVINDLTSYGYWQWVSYSLRK